MKKIQSALISVFYKDGLDPIVRKLHEEGVTLYSTGGTYEYITRMGVPCVPVETLTGYPSILGGRVKTLHPLVFGGILGRRHLEQDQQEMKEYGIPEMDLVIVDLYPFEETLSQWKASGESDESPVIEKIDIGGPSMIRAAAKNHRDVSVIASSEEYGFFLEILQTQGAATHVEQRRYLAGRAFDVCTRYDSAISNYFNQTAYPSFFGIRQQTLRYGENPHQSARFIGDWETSFRQLHGKELSYNNLVDADAALQLIREFSATTFAIIKHTNVCGVAQHDHLSTCWKNALAGDPESAFGGVLVCNVPLDTDTARCINEIFFEVLIAPEFAPEALDILRSKKNRILLQSQSLPVQRHQFKSLLNGVLVQDTDQGTWTEWKEEGGRPVSSSERADLEMAWMIAKHLKSNAIALVKNRQLIGKGCGQTSRVDAVRQALAKAVQSGCDTLGAVMASDAFFPFDDCVRIGHEAGITAFIQPGGSIRDADSIGYCRANGLAMVLTAQRHFKH